MQGQAVDGWEHERQANADGDEAVEAVAVGEGDGAKDSDDADDGC
jgi:hypothetical protein